MMENISKVDGSNSGTLWVKRVTLPSEDADDAEETQPLLSSSKKLPFPKSVFFIFLNEFCERYSFYGLEAILALFLRNVLNYTETASTVIYHLFVTVSFTMPFLGGIFGDSILGKFKTTVYFSIAHSIGSCALAVGALPYLSINVGTLVTIIALLVTAVGIGGIKPNVAAFGGDQFKLPEQAEQLTVYFSIYYISINVGATLSEIFTPMLRKDVGCFGQETCYSLAFAVPAILMIMSLVAFVLGKVPGLSANVLVIYRGNVAFQYAIGNRNAKPEGGHWLDSASDKYSHAFIQDIKSLFRVCILLSPLTIWWSLWSQMGTTWTFQATRMNGYISDTYTIKPDQIQVTNSFLILFLIPFFDMVLYPSFAKCHCLVRSIRRITLGCFLMILSFVTAGLLEVQLAKANPVTLSYQQTSFNFVSSLPCDLMVTVDSAFAERGVTPDEKYSSYVMPLDRYGNTMFSQIPAADYNISVGNDCYYEKGSSTPVTFGSLAYLPQPGQVQTFLVTTSWNNDTKGYVGIMLPSQTHESLAKSDEANAKIRLIADIPNESLYTVYMTSPALSNYSFEFNSKDEETLVFEIQPGTYNVTVLLKGNGTDNRPVTLGQATVLTGGSYLMGIYHSIMSNEFSVHVYTLTKPNTVHMLWQLPQYVFLTLAEILVAVTGYHFAYDQAPLSMKSTLQSIWLMTNAGGNLVIVFIVAFDVFPSYAVLFFFFAGLMFFGMVLFIYLGYQYIPRPPDDEEEVSAETPPHRRRASRRPSIAEAVATGVK